MIDFYPVLADTPLFSGISMDDIPALLSCLGARKVQFTKNQVIFQEGEPAEYVGIVLSGSVQIIREDYYGKRSILAHVEPGELFGESFACAGVAALPISVFAARDGQALLIDCRRITVSCTSACSFHTRMIHNLLRVVATKNLMFHQKLEITTKRTTREKLMAYLLQQAKLNASNTFTIPYDRQGLADYLGVDRSAMAAEISKLRKDGIIACDKSYFELL